MNFVTQFDENDWAILAKELDLFLDISGLINKIVFSKPKTIAIDFIDLVKFLSFKSDKSNLRDRFFSAFDYAEHYENVITLFSNIIKDKIQDNLYKDFYLYIKNVNVHTQILKIGEINQTHHLKLIALKGVIKNVSDKLDKTATEFFDCTQCDFGKNIMLRYERDVADSTVRQNLRCPACSSKRLRHLPEKTIKHSIYRYKIEEPSESTELSGTSVMDSLFVQIKNEIIDYVIRRKINVGDRVIITGKLIDNPVVKKSQTISNYFLDAFSIDKDSNGDFFESLTKEDEQKIIEESKKEDFIDKLVRSIAPNIEGYEECKTALVIQELSGINHNVKVWDVPKIKKQFVHLILAGDPSSGKTQIIKFMMMVIPKYYSASGDQVTIAGLTGTVYQDKTFGGDWSLSAGAFALANKGTLIIDELNKLSPQDISKLNSALSDYVIPFHKATIHTNIYTETKLIGIMNPSSNDQWSKGVSRQKIMQLNLKKAFLSRVTLIFPFFEDDLSKPEQVERALKRQQGMVVESDIYDEIFIKKFFVYAKRKRVEFDNEELIKQKMNFYNTIFLPCIKENITEVEQAEKWDKEEKPAKMRLLADSYEALLSGLCRLKVTDEDIVKPQKWMYEIVNHFLKEYYLALYFIKEQPMWNKAGIDISGGRLGKRDKIFKLLEFMKNTIVSQGIFSFDDLMSKWKEIDVTETEFDLVNVLESLKKSGDIYEPKKDFYSLV